MRSAGCSLLSLVAALSIGAKAPPRAVPDSGPCPVSAGAPCAITLAGPSAPSLSPECTSEEWSKLLSFPQPGRFSDSNGDGVSETVLEIHLDPTKNCGCARFRIFFGDEISGWAVHVGASPTNNGHGGDEGTTTDAAEVHLLDRQLTVYSVAQSLRRQIDRLLDVTVPPLEDRVVLLEACDQSLGFEIEPTARDPRPSKWRLETLSSKLLFSLVPSEGRSQRKRGSLYAAFNRVIHQTTGPPSHARVGRGVRRVEVSLIP